VNRTQIQSLPTTEKSACLHGAFLWVLLLACCIIAVNNQSLWTDEALTAMIARKPTFGEWWHQLAFTHSLSRSSNVQMPLYMFGVWVYAKLFGSSEIALRAFNVPWFLGGAIAFIRSFPGKERAAGFAVLVLSPFVWYYLGEARPYAMQLGGSLMVIAALRVMSRGMSAITHNWFIVFCLGLIWLAGSSLTGTIWVASALAMFVALLGVRESSSLVRRWTVVSTATIVSLLFLGVYYFWTLMIGARATTLAGTNWTNIGFALYELAGFTGLGPGRLELREMGVAAVRPHLPWLLTYGMVLMFIAAAGIAAAIRLQNKRRLAIMGLCLFLPFAFLLGTGIVTHFRVLGRHLAPLEAVWLPCLALGVTALWSQVGAWKKGIVVLFAVLSLVSCLSLRFAERHARDDCRSAARLAQTHLAKGEMVWWSATDDGAEYYGLPLIRSPGSQKSALFLMNPNAEKIASLPTPDLVVVSRPDTYDAHGAVANFLKANNFVPISTFQAFTIWRRTKA
jgi:hypothetical protein